MKKSNKNEQKSVNEDDKGNTFDCSYTENSLYNGIRLMVY